jgi:hypothetical protein
MGLGVVYATITWRGSSRRCALALLEDALCCVHSHGESATLLSVIIFECEPGDSRVLTHRSQSSVRVAGSCHAGDRGFRRR